MLAGLAAFWLAAGAEALLVRKAHALPLELTWISDVILAAAFAAVTFLWGNLKLTRAELLRAERARIAFDTELGLAARIQRHFLPGPPPPEHGWRWAARMMTAGRVGGDFYDFVPLGPGSLLVVVGDISGKGIPAALLLASTRELFHLTAREDTDPAALVAHLSERLYAENDGSPYVTCLVLRVDLVGRRVVAVNAGHPPGWLLTGGRFRSFTAGGPPAGLFPGNRYATETFSLEPGDAGLLVTDGLTEALEECGQPCGDALAAALRRSRGSGPDAVCDAVFRLAGQAASLEIPVDDRTAVCFVLDEPKR